jgi:ribonuclease HI
VNSIIRLNGYSMAFFDGASVERGTNCGAGGTIICRDLTEYRWHFNGGAGTNTKAELLGAWASLFIAKQLEIQYIQLIGDSKVVIDWLNKKGNIQAINIEGWKGKIRELISSFRGIYFQHIFREANVEVNKLSKQALSTSFGRLIYTSWDGENAGTVHHFDIF